MGILGEAPVGGIVAEISGTPYPLLLRNNEIERFERQHPIGALAVVEIGRAHV